MKKHDVDKRKYYLATAISTILKVFWVFPVQKNKIICVPGSSDMYCDSGKYITEYFVKNHPGEYKIVWPLRERDQVSAADIIPVKPRSLLFAYHFATAKVIITNSGMPPHMPKRKTQFCINTWHGGGAYKKVGPSSKYRTLLNQRKSRCTDVFLASCKAFADQVIPDLTCGCDVPVMRCGLPRNDVMFMQDKSKIRRKVCSTLGIDESKILILFAPTFRGKRETRLVGKSDYLVDWSIDVEAVCDAVRDRFGGESVFLFRQHRWDASKAVGSAIDAFDYPDMQELLCAVDILITDYSSSVWDFSITKKPCFLYAPDLEEYESADRGFYTPIEVWPGILTRTNEQLQRAIRAFDKEAFELKVDRHHQLLHSYENGTACERVCGRIEEVTAIRSLGGGGNIPS